MAKRRTIRQLIEQHPAVDCISNDTGDGIWVYLHSGWSWRDSRGEEMHAFRHETWQQAWDACKDVEPCSCDKCLAEAAESQGNRDVNKTLNALSAFRRRFGSLLVCSWIRLEEGIEIEFCTCKEMHQGVRWAGLIDWQGNLIKRNKITGGE